MDSSSFSFPPTPTSAITDPKSNPRKPSTLPINQNNQLNPEIDSKPQVRKLKGSPQLNRWSRARTIRAGRRLDRPVHLTQIAPVQAVYDSTNLSLQEEMTHSEDESDTMMEGKSIYMVSDGTGWTAEHSVNAALGQFEHCLVDRGCAVNTHLFSGIDDVEHLMEIIKQAAKEGATLLYTLADPSMAESARLACKLWGVPSNDILGPSRPILVSLHPAFLVELQAGHILSLKNISAELKPLNSQLSKTMGPDPKTSTWLTSSLLGSLALERLHCGKRANRDGCKIAKVKSLR